MSCVYLAHFEKPFHHSRHYIGYTSLPIELRVKRHRQATGGARLLRAVNEAGIEWWIARVWQDGDQGLERALKRLKKSSTLCPVCTPDLKGKIEMTVARKDWPMYYVSHYTPPEDGSVFDGALGHSTRGVRNGTT